ncbi:hypothetical protein [Streptomyces cupreus]|uniref:Uncharacterized protein n=1 Tax=Streptomyces cupreus TaxID=2759956 RepID=A0A7X1J7K7_9ACTN|nr:hypothetical protein [Streptomyces cupreus]MBC2903147.1 hypothetical protein [Streptomyces cupreus]
MAQDALGRLFDISTGFVPVDMQTAQTGKRVSLRDCGGVTVVLFKAAGTAGDDPTLTLKEHTASTGGTSQNLAIIDEYWIKTEATLDGDETWTRETQAAAATIADPGGDGTSAEAQQIVVFEVDGRQLSDGYSYISVDVADTGTNAQLGCVLYLLRDLNSQRTPANLAAPLS